VERLVGGLVGTGRHTDGGGADDLGADRGDATPGADRVAGPPP
jgi:hypothetical protein